jgi:hypothetical protein
MYLHTRRGRYRNRTTAPECSCYIAVSTPYIAAKLEEIGDYTAGVVVGRYLNQLGSSVD